MSNQAEKDVAALRRLAENVGTVRAVEIAHDYITRGKGSVGGSN